MSFIFTFVYLPFLYLFVIVFFSIFHLFLFFFSLQLKAFYVDLIVPLESNIEKDTKVVQVSPFSANIAVSLVGFIQ